MSIDVNQLREIIVKPALTALGLNTPSAVQLLMGTCAQETQLGKFLVQQGIGFRGGIGIYQMQSNAYDNLWMKLINPNPILKLRLRNLLGYDGKPLAERMASDLFLATAMARLYYLNVSEPLPFENDIMGMAQYYKKFWNTTAGKATPDEFVQNYQRYVHGGGQ